MGRHYIDRGSLGGVMKKLKWIVPFLLAVPWAHANTALTLYAGPTTYFQLFPSSAMPRSYSFTMPPSTGAVNQVLSISNSSGNVLTGQWATPSGGGGSPGGVGTELQYRNGSSFGPVAGSSSTSSGPVFSSATIKLLGTPAIYNPAYSTA